MKHNQLRALYCAIGFSALVPQGVCASRSFDCDREVKPENVVLGVVGGIAAGISLWAFGSYMEWWNAPSNEELIERGRQYISQANEYDQLLSIVSRSRMSNCVIEQSLYECAIVLRGRENISSYICSLDYFVSQLKTLADKLESRINDIERKGSSRDRRLLNDMRNIFNNTSNTLIAIKQLSDYLNNHCAYFSLFEEEDRLAQKYARELEIMRQYPSRYDYTCANELYTTLSVRNTGTFGLIKSMNVMRDDITNLKSLVHKARMYSSRAAYARSLLDTLEIICEIVVSSGAYRNLLIQYEAAEREKERLRLERERLANERRIAHAHEREAYALEEQNRLKAQENRLKEQELYEHRIMHATRY
jgi:hypothetical protein